MKHGILFCGESSCIRVKNGSSICADECLCQYFFPAGTLQIWDEQEL